MKLAASFFKWMPQELFWVSQSQEMIPVYKVKGPTRSWRYDDEDDEKKEDNLQWKQNASRSWWKLVPEPKLKVEIPSQHCQMEQMLQIRREAQLLMDWTHPIRFIRLRAWVYVEALSRQSSWFHEVQEAWKHPTVTIQVYIFWDKLCSNLFWSSLWKANTWRSFLQQVSGLCMWRSSTEDIGPWDERRTITKGQGRHRMQEGSASRGCKIGRQRVQVLWWTDQRSHRIIFGRVYWQKSWKCWVSIKGIGSPSLDPLEIAKEERFGFSLRSSTRTRSVGYKDQPSKVPTHN